VIITTILFEQARKSSCFQFEVKGLDQIFEKSGIAIRKTNSLGRGFMLNVHQREFDLISDEIRKAIPKVVDGQKAILDMKSEGSTNWRQMEWIGFWFEHFVQSQLKHTIGATTGPTYGSTTFDLKRNFVWDLKSHPINVNNLILNDVKAIESCIKDQGGLGFVILSGNVDYDDEHMSFKKWHDQLKGGMSTYEKERVGRKAPSRRRKTKFMPTKVDGIWFDSFSEIEMALSRGHMAYFQKGMRNSNGKPRPEKIMIKNASLIEDYLIGSKSFI
jgi:hypothetical protein